MRRIVQTSRGWIDIELDPHGWHDVTAFGEDGWECGAAIWREDGSDAPPLAAVIVSTASLQADEAERIAEEVLRDWNARRHTAEARREKRQAKVGIGVVSAVAALALVGFVLGLGALVLLVRKALPTS